MSISWINASAYSPTIELRKPFRVSPKQSQEMYFGFLLRLFVGVVSVVVPIPILVIAGALNGWQLGSGLLFFYGVVIGVTILTGEHFRSRAYERVIAYVSRDAVPVISQSDEEAYPLSPYPRDASCGRLLKRVFDVVVASVSLVLLMPLFIVTAVAVVFDSPGRILVRQRRFSFDGRPFTVLKFRTAPIGTSEMGRTDRHVTKVGSFLRRNNLDELPQIFNVLRGEMSLVGPRPPVASQFKPNVALFGVKPGLTGWSQLNLRPRQVYAEREKFDLWYVDHWTFLLDLKIILRTIVWWGSS